jgi:peptide/nickel transport system substrate-binding protein
MTSAVGGVSGTSRRSLLAGLAAALAGTGGCLSRARAVFGREEAETVALSVKTLPVDEDPFAIGIARRLVAWLDAAGIDASVQPMAAEELFQQTFLNHDFELFVAQFPLGMSDPDALYALLHSTYSVEAGRQNPFGYTNLLMDDLLDRQRAATGTRRADAVTAIQRQFVGGPPFTVVGFPRRIRAARTDRFTGWNAVFDPSPTALLSLHRVDESATTLRATTPDNRPMANLNPLMATYRGVGDVTDLIFDPLARQYRGHLHPWAAADWAWTGEEPPELDVTIREGLTWHDGEPLTAEDVALTYDLLRDTSLGSVSQPVPATRFRGRSSLVEGVEAVDDLTVRIRFGDCSRAVARRALTVPLLPAHVWTERTARASVSGVDVAATATEALVDDAIPPVGSGPLEFESVSQRQRLTLSRFGDHFLHDGTETDLPDPLAEGAPFERFELSFVASDSSAVNLLAEGEADVTAEGVGPDLTGRIEATSDVSAHVTRSDAPYVVGCNTRRSPLANPRFRRLLARLLDRETLAESVFEGYVEPAVSPLAGTDWLPRDLAWSPSETAFLGTDGRVDPGAARAAFRSAGYRYNEQGRLVR